MFILFIVHFSLSLMEFLSKTSQELLYLTPVKLSQVPPAEVLIIGCDKRPELPVMVKKKP